MNYSRTLVKQYVHNDCKKTHQDNVFITIDLILQVPQMQIGNVRRRERVELPALIAKGSRALVLGWVKVWRRQMRFVLEGRAQADLPLRSRHLLSSLAK